MSKTRRNHYVPEWYQKNFLLPDASKLHHLDIHPDTSTLDDGRIITKNSNRFSSPFELFCQQDLYTTFFGKYINDEVERYLFGEIDNNGSKAVRSFISGDMSECHKYFSDFFQYMDIQKIRTPKGLDWIKGNYTNLNQVQLMVEMQAIRNMHCTIWAEGVREIVSAGESSIKFIVTDHPVVMYNYACPPDSKYCIYPNDPPNEFKATQTIFPLDINHCLILTNYEYAKNPNIKGPTINRTNARNFSESLVRTDAFIRNRKLNEEEVTKINFILKSRARRFVAAAKKEWLYPESNFKYDWTQVRDVLLPPKNELYIFGGEMYVGYEDGTTHYQDQFGRTTKHSKILQKQKRKRKIGANEPCICGSGKKNKNCCRNKYKNEKQDSDEISIRERNLIFYEIITKILGLDKGKSWEDIRRDLSDQQVKDIHNVYGDLWPKDTNLLELLPQPDINTSRALYMGLMDPRVIDESVISSSLYFDEIIIINPFTNPATVKPEYSPTESPSYFKSDTLKNVLFFMKLIDFVELGYINIIPDPCDFNPHLRKQTMDMAKDRATNFNMDNSNTKQLEDIFHDDFARGIRTLPDHVLKSKIIELNPELTDEEANAVLNYSKKKRLEDPLALLQDTIAGERGAQYNIGHLSPNYELALFIAQITGSFLLTDNEFRWSEIINSPQNAHNTEKSLWQELSDEISKNVYVSNTNLFHVLDLRIKGRLGFIRNTFKRIHHAIQTEKDPRIIKPLTNSLKSRLHVAIKQSKREINTTSNIYKDFTNDVERFNLNFKFNFVAPTDGFSSNNVHRLLISYGSKNHLMSVPMAVFFEPTEEVEQD